MPCANSVFEQRRIRFVNCACWSNSAILRRRRRAFVCAGLPRMSGAGVVAVAQLRTISVNRQHAYRNITQAWCRWGTNAPALQNADTVCARFKCAFRVGRCCCCATGAASALAAFDATLRIGTSLRCRRVVRVLVAHIRIQSRPNR